MNLENIHIIGDKILIDPIAPSEKTSSGLYLPPTVQEKDKVQKGYVIKVGPGYPIPFPVEADEPWKEPKEQIKYIPLQVKVGDLAIFLINSAIEIFYDDKKFYIIPHHAVLMVERIEW
ncbi:MAG: co-chaperone GroES family protein [Bacteroidia bacterium]|nr:co-chaperone GroES family protein [Bacteroidia bacterium]